MSRTRDTDWRVALAGVVMVLVCGFAGRTAPGLWVAAIRYADAPDCATPDQRDCVRHFDARVMYVTGHETARGPEYEVGFLVDRSLAGSPPLRPVELVHGRPSVDRLALGMAARVTVRVWDGRVTAIGRDGVGHVETWHVPWHAAVEPTAWVLTGVLGGLALLALAGGRRRAAIASAVAAGGAFGPVWVADRLGRTTAPEALAIFLVAVTGTALLLSLSRTGARASPPRPRAALPAAR